MKSTSKDGRIKAQDVASLAGVSISAVSRAFTPGASVAPATLNRVMEAANKLGYRPNALARSLMTGRTELIGLVSNNFDNPAFMEIFDLFTRKLQECGLRPLLVNLSGNSEPAEAVAMLRQYNVDAVIVASSSLPPAFIEACEAAHIPLVHAFGKPGRNASTHVIGADNVQGGRLAAQVLMDHGYRKVAFLGGPRAASSTAGRLQGFRAGLKEAGMSPVAEVFAARYSHDEGQRLMLGLLQHRNFDALFCGDDILAIGVLDACRENGITVPGDIGILGFNDIAMAGWVSFNLSTIRQPIAEVIVTAVEQAISLVANESLPPQSRRFACTAVLRATLRQQ